MVLRNLVFFHPQQVVSTSRTPGHTKHFQTIFLTANARLCDCPGLVFPSIVGKQLQVRFGDVVTVDAFVLLYLGLVFTSDGVVDVVKVVISENQTDEAYDSVAYGIVKSTLSELEAEVQEPTNHSAQFWAWFGLSFRLNAWTASDSDKIVSGIERKCKRYDSSDFDSVKLMTALTTLARSRTRTPSARMKSNLWWLVQGSL